MKWIGQHIWDFVSRFRNDVYLEDLTEHIDYDAETLVKDNTTGLVQWTKRANAGKVHLYVKAAEDLVTGNAVYASGAVGNSQAIEVSKYIANNTIDERRFVGIMEQDLLAGEFGYAVTIGTLKGIDTTGAGFDTAIGETWLEGDILFASPTYAGELTKTQPSAPNQVIPCAFILKKNSNGTIAIRAYDLGYHLGELHDLQITTPTEGEVLRYNDVSDIWENTDSLVVDASGNVGIGTTSPDSKLHVYGTSNPVFKVEDDGGAWGFMQAAGSNQVYVGSGPSANLSIYAGLSSAVTILASNRNVGIGTTSPSTKLHIEDSSNVYSTLESTGANTEVAHKYRSSTLTSGYYWWTGLNNYDKYQIAYGTSFDNAGTALCIDASGNVGIGTTSPTNKLHVIGDTRIEGDLTVNGTYTQIDTDVLTTEQWLVTNDGTGPAAIINQLGSQDIFDVQDDGTSVFYIEDGGQIGMGTTSPTARLHIESVDDAVIRLKSTDNKAYIALSDNDTNGYISSENSRLSLGANAGTNANNLNIDLSNNNIGIGTSSPSEKLHVNGNGLFNGGLTVGDSAADTFITRGHTYLATTGNNVGIGTTSPGEKLEVEGNISASGNIYAGAFTFSERFRTTVAGTEGFAAIYLNSDSNTGLFQPAADTLGFTTAGSEALRVTSDGNVGIGTTSPGEKLEVNGNVKLNSVGHELQFANHNVGAYRDGNHRLILAGYGGIDFVSENVGGMENQAKRVRITPSGSVGIGTTSPSARLEVSSDSSYSSDLNILSVSGTKTGGTAVTNVKGINVDIGSNDHVVGYDITNLYGAYINNNASGGSATVINNWYGVYVPAADADRVSNSVSAYFGDSVGIGTTSPSQGLHVVDSGVITSEFESSDNPSSLIEVSNNAGLDAFFGVAGGNLVLRHDDYTANHFAMDSSGNVGIGTTSPTAKLHVFGDASDGWDRHIHLDYNGTDEGAILTDNEGMKFRNLTSGNNFYFRNSGNGTSMIITDDHKIGIGTTSPTEKLTIEQTSAGADVYPLQLSNVSTTDSTGVGIVFNVSSNTGYDNARILVERTDSDATGEMSFWTVSGNSGTISERMRIDKDGNVGIGTTSPSEKLEVDGNIKVGDSDEVRFGAGDDLRIYHNGTNSAIDNNTGDLYISNYQDDGDIIFRTDDGSGGHTQYLRIDGGVGYMVASKAIRALDSVNLQLGTSADFTMQHNGVNTILQNFNGNLEITQGADDGDIVFSSDDGSGGTETYFYLDGGNNNVVFQKDIVFVDNEKAIFGVGSDLQIYHDGNDSIIKDAGTGSLDIYSSHVHLKSSGGTNNLAQFFSGGHSYIYANNVLRIEASTSGVEITGDLSVSGSVQRQISTTHHTFTFGVAGSASQDYWVPFIGSSELAAPNVTHRTIAPYTGILKKAIVHSTVAYGTSAQVRFHRINNGTASVFVNDNSTDDVTTNVTADMSTAYSSVAFDFTTGNTFSAGDQIGVSFVRDNTGLGDVAITLVWEYELF